MLGRGAALFFLMAAIGACGGVTSGHADDAGAAGQGAASGSGSGGSAGTPGSGGNAGTAVAGGNGGTAGAAGNGGTAGAAGSAGTGGSGGCPPCPADRPVCVGGWEGGAYCAECQVGFACPDGRACVPLNSYPGEGGGSCQDPNCAVNPTGDPCLACLAEHVAPCIDAGGDCVAEYQAYCQCMDNEGQSCSANDIILSFDPGTPPACQPAADDFRVCVRTCAAEKAACGT